MSILRSLARVKYKHARMKYNKPARGHSLLEKTCFRVYNYDDCSSYLVLVYSGT